MKKLALVLLAVTTAFGLLGINKVVSHNNYEQARKELSGMTVNWKVVNPNR